VETTVQLSTRAPLERAPRRWAATELRRHLSIDDKVATLYRADGSRASDATPNGIWWSAHSSCPGATRCCAGKLEGGGDRPTCYAYNQEHRGDRRNLLNAAAWRVQEFDQLSELEGAQLALELLLYSWRAQLRNGVHLCTFRHLISGDLDVKRARQWSRAWRALAALDQEQLADGLRIDVDQVDQVPYMRSWLYSRSYGARAGNAVRQLLDQDGRPPRGVTLYLSIDRSNYQRAATVLGTWGSRLPLAAMAPRVSEGKRLLDETRALAAARPNENGAYACPVDAHSSRYDGPRYRDQATGLTVGACTQCQRCYLEDQAPDIIFKT